MSNLIEEFNERSLIRRLAERQNLDIMNSYFGGEAAEELAHLAEIAFATPDTDKSGETVFILPGFMGSKLGRKSKHHLDGNDLVWFDPLDIKFGGLGKLSWDPNDKRIEPVGAFHIAYLRMKLTLRAEGIDARYLPYDWRKTPKMNADFLMPKLKEAGKVSLVAHSQGGRVARMLAAQDPEGDSIRRIITIATPHHGLYAPVRALGVDENWKLLEVMAGLDLKRTKRGLIHDVIMNMPGLLEMMPLPVKRQNEDFFNHEWWPKKCVIPDKHVFEEAKIAANAFNALPELDNRAFIIAGSGYDNTPTGSYVQGSRLQFVTGIGDGTVALDLAQVDGIPIRYSAAKHAWMANDKEVIKAVMDLLEGESTNALYENADEASDKDNIDTLNINSSRGGDIQRILDSQNY